MSRDTMALVTPRILVVDDERQIHASLRLRLGRDYELVCCSDARDALVTVAKERFDLCFVDIHMPGMDGFAFIEAAQRSDSGLGYVVLSAFDSGENLRRTIPLHVLDFIGKPLPERQGFEARIPEWIERTRARRREQKLAQQAGTLHRDLDSARVERDVELVASETARDALLQTANLLTTIHAQLITAAAALEGRARSDPATAHLFRSLDETRRTAAAAASVAESFFNSAYASRDHSPAEVDAGLRYATSIALRMSRAEEANKMVDHATLPERLSVTTLSGIDFLLMMVPALAAALTLTAANTTVGIRSQHLMRLEAFSKDPRFRTHLWVNRKNALMSNPGVLINITASGLPFSRAQAEGWLKGEDGPLAAVSARGLIAGLQKSRGLIAISLTPQSGQFQLAVALPV
jgi:DNA-binding response OmpR family regulator